MGFDLLTGRGDTMTVRQGVDLCVTPVCSRSKPMRPLVELVLDGVKATIPYRQGLAAALRCQTLLPASNCLESQVSKHRIIMFLASK